jgi:hypothetical protein
MKEEGKIVSKWWREKGTKEKKIEQTKKDTVDL